jgi:hypothetical protein
VKSIGGSPHPNDANLSEPIMMRRRWTRTEILTVLTRYAGEGPTYLAKQFNRSEDSVSSLARRYGTRTRRKPYKRQTWPAGQKAATR